MSDIQIRKLEKSDAAIYRDIRLEMLKKEPLSFGSSFQDTFKEPLKFFEGRIKNAPLFGAFSNGELVAVAGYFRHQGEKVAHKANIWGVYVKPHFRGQRLSQTLIQKGLDECNSKAEQVLINVSAKNEAAIKIYKSLGFEEFSREPKARKANDIYFDEISMVKFL